MPPKTQVTKLLLTNKDTKEVETITLNTIKKWRFDLFELRQNIIHHIETSKIALPEYHLILTYYNKHKNRDTITKQHRFIRNTIEELFNPRYRGNPFKSSHFFFIERHKRVLSSSDGIKYYLFNQVNVDNMVLDTITNVTEYDLCDADIIKGAYHSHILKSEIPDEVIFKPNKKLRQLIYEVTGNDNIDETIDTITLKNIKVSLLEAVCKKSEIVGNSKASVKVVRQNPKYYYDGFYGWKGYIAYTTKTCFNPDMMVEVIDDANSSLLIKASTIPIESSNKRMVINEDDL